MRAPRKAKAVPAQEAAPTPAPKRQTASRGRYPEVETALGARIRATRLAFGISQGELGATLGVTFQQVQKYESGRDRVAASTLHAIAAALRAHPGSFFDDDGFVPTGTAAAVRRAMTVATDWQRIKDPVKRKRLAALIAKTARESQAEPDSEG